MKKAKSAVESASVDKKRALPIRATKMNAALGGLFVDFLFVGEKTQVDSDD
jgi:hypothetical protein